MKQFKVIAGTHTEDGKTYKKGETFKSSLPLTKMFVGKFEDLGPVSAPTKSSAPEEGAGKKKKKAGQSEDDWDKDKE